MFFLLVVDKKKKKESWPVSYLFGWSDWIEYVISDDVSCFRIEYLVVVLSTGKYSFRIVAHYNWSYLFHLGFCKPGPEQTLHSSDGTMCAESCKCTAQWCFCGISWLCLSPWEYLGNCRNCFVSCWLFIWHGEEFMKTIVDSCVFTYRQMHTKKHTNSDRSEFMYMLLLV